MHERMSLIARPAAATKRTVKKVPFVELMSGRVQGVVSSGSDVRRVYVSFLESGTGNYYCCTNNNRPCGGLRGSPCKHIQSLLDEAILQFGALAVTKYLGIASDAEALERGYEITRALRGSQQAESPGVVFSRFLNYLRYCELQPQAGPVIEMNWFA
jgi:hypothetical protein